MKSTKYVLTAVAGIALSGCSAISNINSDDSMRATKAQGGTPFTQALTEEYRARMTNETDNEYEWDDAAWYARKGLMAAKGEVVLPANVAAAPADSYHRYGTLGPVVKIPPARVAELSAAHGRLTAMLNGGGRDHSPALAARSQAFYDCWVEEEWEQDLPNIAACRTEFLKLETQYTLTQTQMAPATPVAYSSKANTFEVFFDFDRSTIGETAIHTLEQAAARAKQGKSTTIDLTGHTDAAGPDDYNQALSVRRADAVKTELVKEGVPAADITSVGVGKGGQLVPTADGVREPQNRRTEIILK